MANGRYMTAKEAAALLSVKEATLYAYVSRGLIRSEAISDAPRQRLYLSDDVQKLAARKVQRRDPVKVAREALHWGTPILESALTLITENTLYYRGYEGRAVVCHQTAAGESQRAHYRRAPAHPAAFAGRPGPGCQ